MKLILAFVVVLAGLAAQVEHAPTVAQCQADQRLWLTRVEGGVVDRNRQTLPDYKGLEKWDREMSDCEKVDSDNQWRYYNTRAEIAGEEIVRLTNFLDRHQLLGKFREEDAAGKR
jgi:hypothetical protein